jgi:hypothetical protein
MEQKIPLPFRDAHSQREIQKSQQATMVPFYFHSAKSFQRLRFIRNLRQSGCSHRCLSSIQHCAINHLRYNNVRSTVLAETQRLRFSPQSRPLYSIHLHARTFSSSFSTSGEPIKKSSNAATNSYLKVDLERKALQDIFESLMHIKQLFARSVERPRKTLASRSFIDDDNQPLQIRPRLFRSLELVLFSAGESFCTISPDVVMAFHEKVVKRLDDSGYALEGHQLLEGNIAHPDDYWFRANEMKLFPPDRKDMIVVTFNTSVSWLCIYEDIQLIANKFPELPHRYTQDDKILRWTPLMVLAEVTGGTGRYAKERNILSTIMADWPMDIESTKQTISMGGRYPEQVQLAWDFCDLRQRPANEDELKKELEEDFWKQPLSDMVEQK